MKYVDVVIDTKSDHVDGFFSYISAEDRVAPGTKVTVPFSGSKSRSGYVFAVHDECPEALRKMKLKEILSTDPAHAVSEEAVSTATWMRRRYFCRYIDAIGCFAPVGAPPKRPKIIAPDDVDSETDAASCGVKDSNSFPPMTGEQTAAFEAVRENILAGKAGIFLVHGVTGSGKTELYMRIAESVIAAGRKVIVLVPEISLTPQTIARFTERFGADKVAVLHSKRSKGERYDAWMRIKNGIAD
ncbi:MAG: DEAD/DEAH box helicase family protein, partial [Clostridiales Family XIII bacterium]|nr:DEAD/DEAH box helicase family protein [Clostridiales Family XIII bacterium]